MYVAFMSRPPAPSQGNDGNFPAKSSVIDATGKPLEQGQNVY
jgi:hypothetical protein